VLSAIAACVVWTRDEAPESERPFAVLSLDEEDVGRVRLETRARTVEFVRSGDSFRLIVQAGEAAAKPAPVPETRHDHDHGLEDLPLPAPSVAPGQRREFPGNDRCREVFQEVALFEATRDLGVPEAGDLAGFGLDAPEDALVVSTGRGEERFALGKVLYGTSKRYVHREANGKLYVANPAFIEDMKSEGAYIDRRLHSFFLKRADHAVVRAMGRELTLIRTTEFTQEALPLWAPVDRPEEENELYGNWLRKTVGLYAVDFPTEEAQKPSPALQIDYLRGEQLLGTLELNEDLAEDEDSPQRYRARGEITPGDVIVPRFAALEIMQDLDNLLGD
jgi:hypothetical protein